MDIEIRKSLVLELENDKLLWYGAWLGLIGLIGKKCLVFKLKCIFNFHMVEFKFEIYHKSALVL